MKKLILLLLFIPLVSFGQDYGNDSDASKLCAAIQTNNFTTEDYILDQDHHNHPANQTINFDWQFLSEILFLKKTKNLDHYE